MTNFPPPEPQPSQRDSLGFDDFIGIFVAFTTIGAILFWLLSPKNQGFNLTSLLSPSPSPSAQLTPTPSPEARAREEVPFSPVQPVPTQSPGVLAPVPSRPFGQSPTVIPLPAPAPATPTPALSPSPTPSVGQPITFVDVPQNYWARPFIDALSARGVVSGFAGDYFRPDRPVTRAEFAAIVQDAFDQSPGQPIASYNDVSSDFWAVKAIDRATRTGFMRGYPGNVFQPQQQIPRAQVLVALATGLNLAPPLLPDQVVERYQDANQIPKYAIDKIAAATSAGLVVNYPDPNSINPNRNATRAEVAAIVHQALVRAGKTQQIQSQYVVGPKENP